MGNMFQNDSFQVHFQITIDFQAPCSQLILVSNILKAVIEASTYPQIFHSDY